MQLAPDAPEKAKADNRKLEFLEFATKEYPDFVDAAVANSQMDVLRASILREIAVTEGLPDGVIHDKAAAGTPVTPATVSSGTDYSSSSDVTSGGAVAP